MKASEIQDLPLSALKAMAAKATFVPFDVVPDEQQETISDEAALIHQLSLDELKQLVNKSIPLLPLKEKIAKTGLSKQSIQIIETNKYKATLEDIVMYCKGLEIRFKDFMPEFFV